MFMFFITFTSLYFHDDLFLHLGIILTRTLWIQLIYVIISFFSFMHIHSSLRWCSFTVTFSQMLNKFWGLLLPPNKSFLLANHLLKIKDDFYIFMSLYVSYWFIYRSLLTLSYWELILYKTLKFFLYLWRMLYNIKYDIL